MKLINKGLRNCLITIFVIVWAYMASEDILSWIYDSSLYGLIERAGSYIKDCWILNVVFLVLLFEVFVKVFKWLYGAKNGVYRLSLYGIGMGLLYHADSVRFAYALPKFSYQTLWIILLIILCVVDIVKLLRGIANAIDANNTDVADNDKSMPKYVGQSPADEFFEEDANADNAKSMKIESGTLQVDDNMPEDFLGRKKEAELLADYILKNKNLQRAIGVAVTGEWGAGKSVFLNYLAEAFSASKIEPIKFDPWTEQSENIQRDFFKLITDQIKGNDELQGAFRRYLNAVKVTTANNWFSFTLMSAKHVLGVKDKSVAKKKKELADLMSKLKQPIVIFIDDCDRLDAESFKQTVSLVRTTADLPQLIVVVAYDAKRVASLLENYGGTDFLKKMFNVTHTLSRIDEKVIQGYIREQIRYNHKYPIEGFAYPFDNIQLSDYLPTLRDCKIFLNQLQDALVPYSLRKDKYQLDWGALCLLQLLKYHDAYLYERLRANRLSILELHKDRDPKDECYVLRQDIGETDAAKLKLLKKIFEPHIPDDYFVIPSSPECYDSFFRSVMSVHWLSGPEFDELVKNPEGRVDRIKNYFGMDDTNFKPLLAEKIYNGLQNNEKDAFALLVEAVEAYAQEKKGYAVQHPSRNRTFDFYMEVMQEHLYLGALADHAFSPARRFGDPTVDIVGEYLKEATYPLAAFALMSDVLSNTTEKMYDDIIMLYFCELMKRVKEEELGIETRAWICGTIVSPNLYDKFLDAFLDLHFIELIPMTLTFDNGKEGYLIAKHDGLKALFDTNERYQKDMARWMEKKAFDADVLKQHKELVFLTSILNPKNRERYDAKKYPALQPYLKDDDFSCKFEEIKLNRSFWNDESRIIPKDNFVPIMDVNK